MTGVRVEHGERLADCDVWLDRGDGTRAIAGTATVVLPAGPDRKTTVCLKSAS